MAREGSIQVPDAFWAREEIQVALRACDIGALFRLLRQHTGASQTQIGAAVGLEQGYVSKVMAGRRTIRAIDVLKRVADGCGMPDRCRMMLGLAPITVGKSGVRSAKPVPYVRESGEDAVERRNFLRISLAAAGLSIQAPSAAGRRIGADVPRRLRMRCARLRRLDDILGGGDTYKAYLSEYNGTTAILKTCSYTGSTKRELLSVLAEQAQQAGWAAFDAGSETEAERLYDVSRSAAEEAGDKPLAANAMAFRAYQRLGQKPGEAVQLSEAACRVAGLGAPGGVRALLQERLACAYSITGDTTGTERALAQAHAALSDAGCSMQPDWCSWVDQRELQIMAGRCWTTLNRPLRAVPALVDALADFPDAHARDKALYLCHLAESYLAAGEIEQAASVSAHVLDLIDGVASVRPRRRIVPVLRRLAEHSRLPAVSAVLDRARTVVSP